MSRKNYYSTFLQDVQGTQMETSAIPFYPQPLLLKLSQLVLWEQLVISVQMNAEVVYKG